MMLFNYSQYHNIALENVSKHYEATALHVVNIPITCYYTFQYLPLKRLLDF